MYTPQEVLSGIRDPRKAFLELNRIYHRKIRGQTGIKVMEEDWDNLIILDACRYDLFKQTISIEGNLTRVTSGDSSTSGFLKHNFTGREFPDTVHISANPQIQRHGVDSNFHQCIKLWNLCWDNEIHTVLPKNVTDYAIKIHKEYPNKRLIIHYIQPHYPFIGETGENIDHRSVTGDGVIKETIDTDSIWDQLRSGSLSQETVWQAYQENLNIVIPEVNRLVNRLDGKSVLTSDHGNCFGELGVFGHPGGVFLNSLVSVPWFEIGSDQRRRVTSGDIHRGSNNKDVSDRLADLGYV